MPTPLLGLMEFFSHVLDFNGQSRIRRRHALRLPAAKIVFGAAHIVSAGRRHIPRCNHRNGLRTQDHRDKVFSGGGVGFWPHDGRFYSESRNACSGHHHVFAHTAIGMHSGNRSKSFYPIKSFSRHPPDAPAGDLLIAPPSRGTKRSFGLSTASGQVRSCCEDGLWRKGQRFLGGYSIQAPCVRKPSLS
jgi:hypothetical protein